MNLDKTVGIGYNDPVVAAKIMGKCSVTVQVLRSYKIQ